LIIRIVSPFRKYLSGNLEFSLTENISYKAGFNRLLTLAVTFDYAIDKAFAVYLLLAVNKGGLTIPWIR